MCGGLPAQVSVLTTHSEPGRNDQPENSCIDVASCIMAGLYCCGAGALETEDFAAGRRSESAVNLRIRFWKVMIPTR